jgi:dolichol-phosphate mannosyltransferase
MESRANNRDVAVVVATLNEEAGVGPTLEEVNKVMEKPYLLVVDGNSVDMTVMIAKDLGADVVFQDGKGKGQAISQGVKHINSDARYVVFTDADYTYPAEYIPKMIEVLDHDETIGMVIGNRFNGEQKSNNSMKNLFYLGNKGLAFAQRVLNGVSLNDPLSGLRVVRTEVLKGWEPKSKGFDIEAELNFHIKRRGYRTLEIPIDYRKRLGEKKLKGRHAVSIFKRILLESL